MDVSIDPAWVMGYAWTECRQGINPVEHQYGHIDDYIDLIWVFFTLRVKGRTLYLLQQWV